MINIKLNNLVVKLKKATATAIAACLFLNITGDVFAQLAKPQPNTTAMASAFGNFLDINSSENTDINLAFLVIPGTLSLPQLKAQLQGPLQAQEGDAAFYQAAYNIYKTAVVEQERQIGQTATAISKIYKYDKKGIYSDALKNRQGANICIEGICTDKDVYMQAVLRTLINEGAGIGSTKQFNWNKEIMLAYAPLIANVLADNGANLVDTATLQKYFAELVKTGVDYCDNDTFKADIAPGLANGEDRDNARQAKQSRQIACQNLGAAIRGLALLDVSAAQKTVNAKLIYTLLKDAYMDDYGALVLINAISGLMAIDTPLSYNYIETFLLQDSLSDGTSMGSLWQAFQSVFDLISVNAWGQKITDISNRTQGRSGKYLNRVTERFSYIDEDAAKAMGFSDFSISIAKNSTVAYNMPYGNILEDIGLMLATSQSKYAKAIAAKAIARYKLSLNSISGTLTPNIIEQLKTANKYVHTPLAIGAIAAGAAGSKDLVKTIYNADWWDVNEGTQRRINNLMVKPAKIFDIAAITARTQDEAKRLRAETNQKVATATIWADVLVGAVFLTQLIASLPAMARSAYTLGRVVNIRVAGKAKLLKTVSANIKAQGISPKLARYSKLNAQYQAAQKAQIAAKAAPQTVAKQAKQKAIHPADVELVNTGNNTVQLRFKWQAQQTNINLPANNNLTVQIGGGNGGGAAAVSTPAVAPIAPQKPIATMQNVANKVRTAKPATQTAPKQVEGARIKKAVFAANIDYAQGILGQFAKTLKSKTGATLLGMNLSVMNPVALNAAQASNAFNLSTRGAGLVTEVVSGSGGIGAISKSGNYYAALNSALKTTTTAKQVLPIKIPTLPRIMPALSLPKYAFINTPFVVNGSNTAVPSNVAASLPEGWTVLKQSDIKPTLQAKRYTTHTATDFYPSRIAQNQPMMDHASISLLLLSFLVPSVRNQVLPRAKQFFGFNQNSHLKPGTGLPGSDFRMPKGTDLKKGVGVFNIGPAGQEAKLPLTFNIDKGIKVTNQQRAVFNEHNRLEIRNGTKKPQKIDGFMMLLENNPTARLAFINAIALSGIKTFRLKVQMASNKYSRYIKEFPIYSRDIATQLPFTLQAPRDILNEGEKLFVNADGNISAINTSAATRLLNNATFRIPKGEIANLIKVLNTGTQNFVFDIRPTQNKALPFLLAFLSSTTIMAVAPAFKEIFGLSSFTTNTLMGIISFGPAIAVPFMGYLYKKYGMVNVMKLSSMLTVAGVALAVVSGFYGYASSGMALLPLLGAAIGLAAMSLSNEMKFSTMSPLLEANFEGNKGMSVTTQSLMARSIGTILFLQFPAIFNLLIAKPFNLSLADDTIAFAALLLPIAALAAFKMLSVKLRDLHTTQDSNITPITLLKTFMTNSSIRKGAAAFILFESFEATLSLLLFQLAKDFYPAASVMPGILGGTAIYGAMAAARMLVGKLQEKDILDGRKTYIASSIASLLGLAGFAFGGISTIGLVGAATAFMGLSNFFPPLYNATKNKNPDKAGEISLIFFTATTLAALSTMLLGLVMDLGGPAMLPFAIPLACIGGALILSAFVYSDAPVLEALFKKLGITKAKPTTPTADAPQDTEADGDINNALPN